VEARTHAVRDTCNNREGDSMMKRYDRSGLLRVSVLVLVAAAVLWLAGAALAAAKKYQVTGKVLEVSDKLIVVQKDDDKWELERTATTKIEGDLKVGARVTISYHMVADSGEVKAAGAEAKDSKK
jgi:hypothetical protein